MRIVVALGGNALLKRGEAMTAEVQRANVCVAADSLAAIAEGNELVITHGNGPQVGLLALQDAAHDPEHNFPLDVLGAESEGMIGYMIEQELGNRLPFEVPFATLLTMVEVDADDPAFKNPTKFVGPVYSEEEANRLQAKEASWVFKKDGDMWRRVVASPAPKRIFEIRPVRWLLEQGTVVICAGGGGIPTMYDPGSGGKKLIGVEAVIDKDFCSELLARELDADLFVMLTDADAVYLDWGKPEQRAIRKVSAAVMGDYSFAAGSMGPKVQAARNFATVTGKSAAIGALEDLADIIAGKAGTTITDAPVEMTVVK
ncbi:MAG TPA: carbamate kinase [Xanthomonadales bacterium]|nr:carbamate kinase [Xanthomonadales bacterium]